MESDQWLLLLAALALVFLFVIWRMHLRHRSQLRKVEFLFNAIDNLDFAFRFPVRGSNRTFNTALNRIKDILTASHYAQQERERYYEKILSMVSTAILVEDDRGRVVFCNDAALRLLRRDSITHISQVENDLKTGRFSVRRNVVGLDGRQMQLWAVNDISSELVLQEITSWEKLIRVLTHEIMNGVAPVTSLSRTLLQRVEHGGEVPAETLRQGLQTIHSTSDQLLRFVENYRSLTLLPTPAPQPFYVKPFLERMLMLARATDRAEGLQMECSVSPADLMLYADESLLTHVFTNLLKNAVEALQTSAAQERYIRVEASIDEAETVRIRVSNNGPAIPADVAEQMFVPFFTTKNGGSGIGLSLSARIMQASGARMELVESSDRETVFLLTFDA
ncbi:MAG: GHKL domain-containing protein [Bacteroidaceae bacterium]|nr:GHKL domain-containing protein [Bacteroidaceae bacterium]